MSYENYEKQIKIINRLLSKIYNDLKIRESTTEYGDLIYEMYTPKHGCYCYDSTPHRALLNLIHYDEVLGWRRKDIPISDDDRQIFEVYKKFYKIVASDIKKGFQFTDAEGQKFEVLAHSIQKHTCKVKTPGGVIRMIDQDIMTVLLDHDLCLAMVVGHAEGTARWTILDTSYPFQRQIGTHDSIYPMRELKNIKELENMSVFGL